MTQYAVGQGGLHAGQLSCDDQALRWLYDCGSNQSVPLQYAIREVAAGGPVKLLFLSHLDSDHVSGVDRLLATVPVEEVVIPYFSDTEYVATLCKDLEAGSLSGTYLDFISDAHGWFSRRGVRLVTYVASGDEDDGDGGIPPELPRPVEDGDLAGPVLPKWSKAPEELVQRGAAVTQRVQADAFVHCAVGGQPLDWVLVPFVHRPSEAKLNAFRAALRAEFGRWSRAKLIAAARTELGRASLKKCYGKIWDDHNLVSMSLYSGPISQRDFRVRHQSHQFFGWELRRAGWLNTGDAKLSGLRRRAAFLMHYAALRPNVTVFQLPHHGSFESFHPDLLAALPNLRIAFAAAGPNPYGHPHPGVVNAIGGYPHFRQVDDQIASALRLHGIPM